MIVKILFSSEYERIIECDTIAITRDDVSRKFGFLTGGKLVEEIEFKEHPADIFIMENGKTIDRINFNPKA